MEYQPVHYHQYEKLAPAITAPNGHWQTLGFGHVFRNLFAMLSAYSKLISMVKQGGKSMISFGVNLRIGIWKWQNSS
jgi:hypothetical protein